MPTVPKIGQRVEQAPIPGARLSTGTAGAFDVSPGINLDPAVELGKKLYEQEKEKADQSRLTGATSQLSETETQLLYDPETGALNKQGEDALAMPDQVTAAWTRRVGEIRKSLTSDRQRRAFDQVLARYSENLDRQVQRHVGGERQKLYVGRAESLIGNEQAAATLNYRDPERIQTALIAVAEQVRVKGDLLGWSKEETDRELAKEISATHFGVLSRMQANNQNLLAKSYLEQNREGLVGDDLLRAEDNVREGSIRSVAHAEMTRILATGPANFTAAKELARATITDTDVMDETITRLSAEFNSREQDRDRTREDNYIKAADIVERNIGRHPRTVVPPALWNSLMPDNRATLIRMSKIEDDDYGDDSQAWLDFLGYVRDPQQLATMGRLTFETRFRSRLNKGHRAQAESMWANAGAAAAKGQVLSSRDFDNVVGDLTRFNQTLERSRIISGEPTSLKGEARATYLEMQSEFSARVAAENAAVGRQLRPSEMQEIIDGVVADNVELRVERNNLRDPQIVLSDVPNLKRDFQDRVYTPYDRVPPDHRTAIENRLRANGRTVNPQKVGRAYYARFVARNDALYLSILQEP